MEPSAAFEEVQLRGVLSRDARKVGDPATAMESSGQDLAAPPPPPRRGRLERCHAFLNG